MIIDFHTHTFPDSLAEHAVGTLARSAGALPCLDGTVAGLMGSMREAGVDYSVLLPVVTKPSQQASINRTVLEINAHTKETGLISFGGIHPDNEDYGQILRHLARNGVKGIKLHPVFQRTYLDDIRYLRIISCACENDLAVLVHAGWDISHPGLDHACPDHILPVLDTLHPPKFVLAHMGGWGCWDQVEERIAGRDLWLDTAFSLLPLRPAPGPRKTPGAYPPLPADQFLRMVKRHGADRILFGTDSPWNGQEDTIRCLENTGLTEEELAGILGDNGARLLHL